MAKYAARGYRVIFGVLAMYTSGYTKSDGKGRYRPSKLLPELHRSESRTAAAELGAELFALDLMDHYYTDSAGQAVGLSFVQEGPSEDLPAGSVPLVRAAAPRDTDERGLRASEQVKDLLLKHRPEITICQSIDRNIDHYAALLIVCRAWNEARRMSPEIGKLYAPMKGRSYVQKNPDWVEDVTGFEETVKRAIACHETQDGKSYWPRMHEHWAKVGRSIGVASAEAFIELHGAA